MSHSGTEDKFLKTLFPSNMDGIKVLDVGFGYGATGLYIRTRTYKNGWCYLAGVEPFQEYYDIQYLMKIYDELHLGYGQNLPFPDKVFKMSIAQHVIEHCKTIEEGYEMLNEMERVTDGRVIICTPNGYTESDALDGNMDNHHLTGWTEDHFIKAGYNTRIVTKNVNSRLLVSFAKLIFAIKGKRWDNEVLVAWKDVDLTDRIEACGCGKPV